MSARKKSGGRKRDDMNVGVANVGETNDVDDVGAVGETNKMGEVGEMGTAGLINMGVENMGVANKAGVADKVGGKKLAGHVSAGCGPVGSGAGGQKNGEQLKIVANSPLVKTEKPGRRKGKSKTQAGSARYSGGEPGEVDTKAIKRMLSWQLELLDRLRVLTLSAIEVVDGKPN